MSTLLRIGVVKNKTKVSLLVSQSVTECTPGTPLTFIEHTSMSCDPWISPIPAFTTWLLNFCLYAFCISVKASHGLVRVGQRS